MYKQYFSRSRNTTEYITYVVRVEVVMVYCMEVFDCGLPLVWGNTIFFTYQAKKKLCQSEDPVGTGSLKLPIMLGKMADSAERKENCCFSGFAA